VGELLAAASQLTVLSTSRERLHLYGEQDYPLQPLELLQTLGQELLEKLLSYEAIDLFVQRARSALPNLEIGKAELLAIIQICTRLDGLPLAIELAASQAKVFLLAVLAAQLEESIDKFQTSIRQDLGVDAFQEAWQATKCRRRKRSSMP
jgi:predicted ATPase